MRSNPEHRREEAQNPQKQNPIMADLAPFCGQSPSKASKKTPIYRRISAKTPFFVENRFFTIFMPELLFLKQYPAKSGTEISTISVEILGGVCMGEGSHFSNRGKCKVVDVGMKAPRHRILFILSLLSKISPQPHRLCASVFYNKETK